MGTDFTMCEKFMSLTRTTAMPHLKCEIKILQMNILSDVVILGMDICET